jgi:Recombination endonuclease VII
VTSATHGLRGRRYQTEYQRLLLLQEGLCAICGRGIGDIWQKNYGTPITQLVIDHCHSTGAIRSLLCSQCNLKVGHVEANNKDMIAWLCRNGDRLIVPGYLAKIRAYLAYWRGYHD